MIQTLVLAIIAIIISLPLRYSYSQKSTRHIRENLSRRNLELIDCVTRTFAPFSSKKGYYFEVTYLNSNHEMFKARCQFGENWELYWTEPQFLYRISSGQAERIVARRSGLEPIPQIAYKSEKEKLIDSLRSGYKHERIWAAREVREKAEVDEQIIHILEEMSVADPDPEVREVASESIRFIT